MTRPAVLAIFPLIAGYILDLLFGDPRRLPHPVRITGTLIQKLEPLLRKIFPETKTGERVAGIVLTVFLPGVSYAATTVLLLLAGRLHIYARLALETLICYQLLAARGLYDESIYVVKALETDGTQSARTALSRIVGRDTANLDERQIVMAAVETVAENTTDGVVAPMLFLAFGGAHARRKRRAFECDSRCFAQSISV